MITVYPCSPQLVLQLHRKRLERRLSNLSDWARKTPFQNECYSFCWLVSLSGCVVLMFMSFVKHSARLKHITHHLNAHKSLTSAAVARVFSRSTSKGRLQQPMVLHTGGGNDICKWMGWCCFLLILCFKTFQAVTEISISFFLTLDNERIYTYRSEPVNTDTGSVG